MSTTVVNLYAGPGAGKSTTAAGLFHQLKLAGTRCELITEFAKDAVWEGREHILHNQVYVFAKQHKRLNDVIDKVDVAITDSPLLLSMYYADNPALHDLVLHERAKHDNVDVFIERDKPYDPKGRVQSEDEARLIDDEMLDILDEHAGEYHHVKGNESAPRKIRHILGIRLHDSVTSIGPSFPRWPAPKRGE